MNSIRFSVAAIHNVFCNVSFRKKIRGTKFRPGWDHGTTFWLGGTVGRDLNPTEVGRDGTVGPKNIGWDGTVGPKSVPYFGPWPKIP